jgi:hypothetical protein
MAVLRLAIGHRSLIAHRDRRSSIADSVAGNRSPITDNVRPLYFEYNSTMSCSCTGS